MSTSSRDLGRLTIVAPVNRDDVLERDLAASPAVRQGHVALLIERGHACAAKALNAGLDRADSELVVFAHQDVYLPSGWETQLLRAVDVLESRGAPWGILGVAGVQQDGAFVGRLWSSGLATELGGPLGCPKPVVSIDEVLIVVRRDSGLRFDEGLPGYHLYGTDIVQTAASRGLGTYVFDAPLIHNSDPGFGHHLAYVEPYRYMRRKWKARLPIPTCVVPITRSNLPLARFLWMTVKRRLLPSSAPGVATADPAELARRIGYEASVTGP